MNEPLRIKRLPSSYFSATAKGFTLPELLVAIFIFSLIGLGSWQLLSQANLNIEIQERKAKQLTEINLAVNQLSDDMQFLLLRSQRINRYDMSPGFQGDSKGFHFVRMTLPTLSYEAKSNLAAIRYEYQDTRTSMPAGGQLIRSTNPYLDGGTEASVIHRSVLSRLANFEIKYLDEDNVYHSEWPSVSYTQQQNSQNNDPLALPRAVHLSFDIDQVGSIYRIFELNPNSEDAQGNSHAG